ncbi:TIR domain-containing protein [Neorhizobium sp. BT27B]|uniref:TIR domain-containing protein n=1 Tax=Neorhizobium sp. BT27B TaxID=3142625 RepID=UPI003D2B1A43
MIKVFVSHQKADAALAAQVAARLKVNHQIDSYLDVIDQGVRKGEDLADHLRAEMGKCTQLLAVVSMSTATSQWVPWEIGVATEKDYPLATFSGSDALPPEFLRKWPYLRSLADLDRYAEASKTAENTFVRRKTAFHESVELAQATSTRQFFDTLRRSLGQ